MVKCMILIGAVLAAGVNVLLAAESNTAQKQSAETSKVSKTVKVVEANTNAVKSVEGSMSLAAARNRIADVIESPRLMQQITSQLSPEDQRQFLADVNAAIAKLPASNEEKTALILDVDRSALRGADKGNLSAMVAEVYATAPLYSLTVVNEEFGKNVLNRSADPNTTFTDRAYIGVSEKIMQTVNKRVEMVSDSNVRAGFAALMLIRAANSPSEEVKNAITAMLPESVREIAQKEWFPPALSDGPAQSYEPMLGMADGEVSRPVEELVLRVSAVQDTDALLTDIAGANTDPNVKNPQANPIVDSVQSPLTHELPNLAGDAANDAGATAGQQKEEQEANLRGEGRGYSWQNTGAEK